MTHDRDRHIRLLSERLRFIEQMPLAIEWQPVRDADEVLALVGAGRRDIMLVAMLEDAPRAAALESAGDGVVRIEGRPPMPLAGFRALFEPGGAVALVPTQAGSRWRFSS